MPFDLKSLVAARMGENYELHSQHLNPTLVQVQRTIGFDRVYVRAKGAYLYDAEGKDYLDFLSGYSVFNIGPQPSASSPRPSATRSTSTCPTWCRWIAR